MRNSPLTVGHAALLLIRARGHTDEAIAVARQGIAEFGEGPLAFLKASVGPITMGNDGRPLVPDGAPEFIEAVQRASLLGRIAGLVPAPVNAKLVQVDSNGSAYWTGESFPKPATAVHVSTLGTLAANKVTATVAVTDELARAGGPTGVQLVTNALKTACGATVDAAFTDPSNSGIDGVKPPYVAAGVEPIVGTGNLLADIGTAVTMLTNPSGAVLLINSLDAQAVAATRTPNGALAYPDLSARGGTLGGLPVFTSDAMPPGNVIVVDPSRIFLWNGGVSLSYSDQALVQLDDAPDAPATAATTLCSAWQANLHVILVEFAVSWMAASGAAAVIENAFVLGMRKAA